MHDQRDNTPPNLRVLRIVEILADARRPLSATEINEHLRLPKATIHRLCNTLEKSGFLTRDPHRGRLRPARRLRQMGAGVLATSRMHVARHAVMERVARRIGETLNLAVPEEQGMSYVDRVDTQWPLRFQLPIGSCVPFHCTASGKLFLSAFREPELTVMLNALELASEGPNCITRANDLRNEIHMIRDRGHSFDNQEFMAGMIAAAVPVRTPTGAFFGALAFHAPLQRMSLDQAAGHLGTLIRGARDLERILFLDAD